MPEQRPRRKMIEPPTRKTKPPMRQIDSSLYVKRFFEQRKRERASFRR